MDFVFYQEGQDKDYVITMRGKDGKMKGRSYLETLGERSIGNKSGNSRL